VFFDFAPERLLPASAKPELPVYKLWSRDGACGRRRKNQCSVVSG